MNLQILRTSQLVPGSHGLEDTERQEVQDTQPILILPKPSMAQTCSHSLSTRHGDDPFGHATFQKLHLSFVKALSFAPTYRANQFQIQLDLFKCYRNLLLGTILIHAIDKKWISKDEHQYLLPAHSRLALFYLLPNVHKNPVNFWKTRHWVIITSVSYLRSMEIIISKL